MHLLLSIAAAATVAVPTAAPVDARRSHAISAIAKGELHAQSAPGLAIGVVEDGLLVYAHGFGYADTARHIRAGAQTKFYAGAISEQFTAAALLLLEQDRKLSLKDHVTRFIPELANARGVTLAQLLSHTSGLPMLSEVPDAPRDVTRPVKWDDVLRSIGKANVFAPPGKQYRRNPLDYTIAALVAQRVAGEPLSVFLQTRVFEPLIMNSTFLAGDQGAGAAARGYTRDGGRFKAVRAPDPTWLFGSSDLVTTIDDLAKWDIGMPLILNVDSVRTMWSNAALPPGMDSYGMGWMVDQRAGQTFVWRNGMLPGYHSMNALLPAQHVAVIVLSNADALGSDSTIAPERVANRVLDIVAPFSQVHVANVIVRRASEWLDRLARVDIDRTQLTPGYSQYLTDRVVLQTDLRSLGPPQSIVPIENFARGSDTVYVFDVRFRRSSMRYQFEVTGDGKIAGLLLEPT